MGVTLKMYAIFIPMLDIGFVFGGTYVGRLGLSVSWLGDLCLALLCSVFGGTYVGHWVCLFVG